MGWWLRRPASESGQRRSSSPGDDERLPARDQADRRRLGAAPACRGRGEPMRRLVAGLLIVVSAVALVLSSVSLWTRQNVIDTDAFVSNVETIVDLPRS